MQSNKESKPLSETFAISGAFAIEQIFGWKRFLLTWQQMLYNTCHNYLNCFAFVIENNSLRYKLNAKKKFICCEKIMLNVGFKENPSLTNYTWVMQRYAHSLVLPEWSSGLWRGSWRRIGGRQRQTQYKWRPTPPMKSLLRNCKIFETNFSSLKKLNTKMNIWIQSAI